MTGDVLRAALLGGPRGRRVCAEVAARADERVGYALQMAARGDATARAELPDLLRDVDVAEVAARTDPVELLTPLADSVVWAMYWQPPGDEDVLLDDPSLADPLSPVAAALAAAPAAAWWTSPVDTRAQHLVTWRAQDPELDRRLRPDPRPAPERLRAWREHATDDERRSAARRDGVEWSGEWWSTPVPPHAPRTTRSLGPLDAVELLLEEDTAGFTEADVAPVSGAPDARVYEVATPGDWVALVATYPFEVTHSRRWDWRRATGRDGRWLIPDWSAVAADHDGVHLTVAGYLAAAGRPLEVEHGVGTVLAGFAPDWTIWLADVLHRTGDGRRWRRDDHGPDDPLIGWAPVQP